MKVTYRIPTEMYAYVEVEEDGTFTTDTIQARYKELSDEFKPKPTNELNAKEFDTFIQNQLLGITNHIETYHKMSPQQQYLYQVNKRALLRIKRQEDKPVIE